MRKRLFHWFLMIAVGGVLALALVGAASANAPSASVSFAGTATLVINPRPVNVPVHYSCVAPSPGQLEVVIDENGVEGTNTVTANCDGQNHSATVTVGRGLYAGYCNGPGGCRQPRLL